MQAGRVRAETGEGTERVGALEGAEEPAETGGGLNHEAERHVPHPVADGRGGPSSTG